MPLSQWLITTNYYEGGYFRPDPLVSLPSSSSLSDSLHLNFSLLLYFHPPHPATPTAPVLFVLAIFLFSLFLVWLIAAEINKASRFVVLPRRVTRGTGDVFTEIQSNGRVRRVTAPPPANLGRPPSSRRSQPFIQMSELYMVNTAHSVVSTDDR